MTLSLDGGRLNHDAPRSTELLVSPTFVAAVLQLVVNDWILKAAYGSWWTGKLSDFAGLYAFPFLRRPVLGGNVIVAMVLLLDRLEAAV